MKIARLVHENNETYGFVKGDKVATKEEITYLTGVPIPLNVKDFLFDGWFDEIKNKIEDLPYEENISKYKLLAPIPNPNKIICLAFNYVDHAKEQGLTAPEDPAIVIKPRTALNGNNGNIECPDFVTQLDYEVELALIIGKNCKISENSVLKGPIIVGDDCVISSSVIGPNVSIGNNSILENCKIENSILMNNCKILSTTHIFDSIIANGSEIKKSALDKKQQFLLGERSQVNL